MQDVRNILIEQMEMLTDPDTEIDMDRCKQINEIGKTLVESAKAEAMFIRAMSKGEQHGTGFLDVKQIE